MASENSPSWSQVFKDVGDLLTFRISRERLQALGNRHLALGLGSTWLVGIGRYWDDPGAKLLQHLGVGSLAYVFALAMLLFLLMWPLRPAAWSYRQVLTFVTLTSPPALLYAIPVEMVTDIPTASRINVWFLLLVASWRVALLFFYLARSARLSPLARTVTTLLPLMGIVVALSLLNLERAVFNIMGGLRESTAADAAYELVFYLSWLAYLAFPFVAAVYAIIVFNAWQQHKTQAALEALDSEP
ncbi:MAG: hypothetical protein H0U74_10290 [Bradymonadaceae bacterium]|nr:hypothetical protein [Lujinxingiaceae bacterium]